ncbi:unnamed protein product [Adineta ricciae]|uniref:Uncharacterized protein n=1 Tax=Adineta ricciae TaxID=249248 RepID=A0A814BTH8_ADIRI|nr:unnamed protein product [Adineta ricciae]CAF1568144.1 unnamed protein product [Adineta ricciae]
MNQTGTTPTTDENRPPATIPTPVYFPMTHMFFSYGNGSTSSQPYYTPVVHPTVAYPSNGTQQQPPYGIGYNSFYPQFYPTRTNLLPPMSHVAGSAILMPPCPLMVRSNLTTKSQSSTGLIPIGNDNERNKNLNIRECQSPVLNEIKRHEMPLEIVDPGVNNTPEHIRADSSSASSLTELEQPLLPPRSMSSNSDNLQDDFLTFLEQKTKKSTTKFPELNPFASEFSFVNTRTPTNALLLESNGIHDHRHSPPSTTPAETQSSYRLLFDNLIEKSLESIEAFKRSTKKASVNDTSVQCNQINDCINRSTQTIEQINHADLLTDYSLRAVKLMDKLLGNFRNIYSSEYHHECKAMAQTCDELHHLILFIHRLTSSLTHQENAFTTDLTNPFSNILHEAINLDQNSLLSHNVGRGTRRLTTSATHPSIPSFSCRQIDPVSTNRPRLCLICQKPLVDDQNTDIMHSLCRTLVSHLNMATNI